jgi:hypothetical protein
MLSCPQSYRSQESYPISIRSQASGRLSVPSPHHAHQPNLKLTQTIAHLLLCVASFYLHRCHRQLSVDAFSSTN